jgi:hypothetical protein
VLLLRDEQGSAVQAGSFGSINLILEPASLILAEKEQLMGLTLVTILLPSGATSVELQGGSGCFPLEHIRGKE